MDINLDAFFDQRGQLQEGANIDHLLDGHGFASVPLECALRDKIRYGTYHAATDLVRLFYAIEAQRSTERKYPAKYFWK